MVFDPNMKIVDPTTPIFDPALMIFDTNIKIFASIIKIFDDLIIEICDPIYDVFFFETNIKICDPSSRSSRPFIIIFGTTMKQKLLDFLLMQVGHVTFWKFTDCGCCMFRYHKEFGQMSFSLQIVS
jgi:hypothetical protein